MGLVILTRSPKFNIFSKESIKNIGCVIFKKNRGSQAVVESLLFGLADLNYKFKFNPRIKDMAKNDIVHVIRSLEALRFAIELKKAGKIRKIIVGPVMVVTPDDYGGIVKDKNIDIYLVPSRWTKDFYMSLGPGDFAEKIKIWAAGVENPPDFKESERGGCLVYKKNVDENLYKEVINFLNAKNISYKIVEYGKYRKNDYLKLLEGAEFMIYLQESESQGLALQEAWLRNVPTFVWNRGYMQWKGYKWYDEKISAPYLSDECGMFFKGSNDFRDKFPLFLEKLHQYRPREYALKNFTDEITAKNYLRIVGEVK